MRIEKSSKSYKGEDRSHTQPIKHGSVNNQQKIMMFLSIFMVLLIIFLGFAKMLSPDVDITLGDDYGTASDIENQQAVDSRLKELQQEDEALQSEEDPTIEDAGLVRIPKMSENENQEQQEEKVVDSILPEDSGHQSESTAKTEPLSVSPTPQPTVNTPVVQQTKTYRVYVGMYSTQAQAEVARGILQDAGLGVNPNIKQVSGGYSLQAGAFSSKDAANALSNKLLMNNYPARVSAD